MFTPQQQAIKMTQNNISHNYPIHSHLKQYKQSKKMAKMLSGGSMKNMEKMMKKVGKGGMPQVKFK